MGHDVNEVTSPIRLIIGAGNNMIQGFSVVYEDPYEALTVPITHNRTRPDVKVRYMNIWFTEPEFALVRFIDQGESCVVWGLNYVPETKSFLIRKPAHFEREVKEIRLRRDVQLNISK